MVKVGEEKIMNINIENKAREYLKSKNKNVITIELKKGSC